jgi:ABC-type branched-subunit amino acid transport system ATPase component
VLEVRDLHTYYGLSHTLQGVSLAVPDRKVISLLGRNGVGKTTTLKSIIGILAPKSGRILLQGNEIMGLSPHKVSRLGISYVPQGRRIFPYLTVAQNLELGLSNLKNIDALVRRKRFEMIYQYFPILEERKSQSGGKLSGGEQQMLAIGRGLIGNTSLMLLDEPSEGLSPLMVKHIGEIIRRICDDGIAILVVEQNAKMAIGISDECYIMEKGKIEFHGLTSSADALKEIRGRLRL